MWFAAAFIPMVASQLLRLGQQQPLAWVLCDYGGRLAALGLLAALPQARAIAFRRESLKAPLWLALACIAGLVAFFPLLNDPLGDWLEKLLPQTALGHYPTLHRALKLIDLSFGLLLVAYHEEVLFRRCALPIIGEDGGWRTDVKSAVLFAVYHWWTGVPNMVEAGLFGLLAMPAYRRLGTLWPLVAAHYLADLSAFV